jgi:hypothetical protein
MKTKSLTKPTGLKPDQIPASPMFQLHSSATDSSWHGPSHDEIAALARILWLKKECPQDRDDEIWLEAEQGLLSGSTRQRTQPFPKTSSDEDTENAHKIEDMLDGIGEPSGSRSATSL